MRSIGIVANEQDARRLGGYLLTVGIASQLDRVPDGYCVWIRDEDQVERARQELASFLQNPSDARYDAAQRAADEIRAQQVRAEKQYRKNVRDLRMHWGRPVPQRCPLTVGLIAACVLVAVGSKMGHEINPIIDQLFITSIGPKLGQGPWQEPLSEVRHGEVWRLITPIFLHFGHLHLIFNLWNLYSLGGIFEINRGTLRLAAFVLVTALVSNLVQYLHKGNPFFGGMSGVLYALFGYAWMKTRFDPTVGIYLPPDTIAMMVIWLFICMTGRVGPVANAAHVGGLISGMVIGIAPVLWRRLVQ